MADDPKKSDESEGAEDKPAKKPYSGESQESVTKIERRKSESGPPPIIEDKTVSTGILDGGRSQVVELELQKGPYAIVCFVADRKGGPPHAFKGMVSEGTAE